MMKFLDLYERNPATIVKFLRIKNNFVFSKVQYGCRPTTATTATTIFIRLNGRKPERATAHQSWLLKTKKMI